MQLDNYTRWRLDKLTTTRRHNYKPTDLEIISMTKILALAMQKGGTAKTTAAINTAAALARRGKVVLLVGLDPQASLEHYFIDDPDDLAESMYDLMLHDKVIEPLKLGQYIRLLPANIDLAAAELALPGRTGNELILKRMLRHYRNSYDFILLDTPPSLSLLTRNAMAAADRIIATAVPELVAMKTIPLLMDSVEAVRRSGLNDDVAIWKIIPTRFDTRQGEHVRGLAEMREKFGDLVYPGEMKARAAYLHSARAKSDVSEFNDDEMYFWNGVADALISESETW